MMLTRLGPIQGNCLYHRPMKVVVTIDGHRCAAVLTVVPEDLLISGSEMLSVTLHLWVVKRTEQGVGPRKRKSERCPGTSGKERAAVQERFQAGAEEPCSDEVEGFPKVRATVKWERLGSAGPAWAHGHRSPRLNGRLPYTKPGAQGSLKRVRVVAWVSAVWRMWYDVVICGQFRHPGVLSCLTRPAKTNDTQTLDIAHMVFDL